MGKGKAIPQQQHLGMADSTIFGGQILSFSNTHIKVSGGTDYDIFLTIFSTKSSGDDYTCS
jgi:hypothetical protein